MLLQNLVDESLFRKSSGTRISQKFRSQQKNYDVCLEIKTLESSGPQLDRHARQHLD